MRRLDQLLSLCTLITGDGSRDGVGVVALCSWRLVNSTCLVSFVLLELPGDVSQKSA